MTVETAKNLIPAGRHAEMEKILELDLDKNSVVVIIGSYQGTTARLIQEAYGCKILCFDPQEDMNRQARDRLNRDATVYDYGLADKEGKFAMVEVGTDGATFHLESSERQPGFGEVREVNDVWNELGIKDVDFLLMNCEGSEFGILERLKNTGRLQDIKHMLVQFHLATVKGNGENYKRWRETLEELGFEVVWTLGAPWTLFRYEESGGKTNAEPTVAPEKSEDVANQSQQEDEVDRRCPRDDCDYVVAEGKSVPSALAGHKRSHLSDQ